MAYNVRKKKKKKKKKTGKTFPGRESVSVPRQGTSKCPRQGLASVPRQGLASVPRQGTGKRTQAGYWQASQAGTANVPRQGTVDVPRQGTVAVPRQGTVGTARKMHSNDLPPTPRVPLHQPTSCVFAWWACMAMGRGALVNLSFTAGLIIAIRGIWLFCRIMQIWKIVLLGWWGIYSCNVCHQVAKPKNHADTNQKWAKQHSCMNVVGHTGWWTSRNFCTSQRCNWSRWRFCFWPFRCHNNRTTGGGCTHCCWQGACYKLKHSMHKWACYTNQHAKNESPLLPCLFTSTYYTDNETVFAATQSFLQTMQSSDGNRLLSDDCIICKKLWVAAKTVSLSV